jgi:hypothetical protein
MTWVGVMQHCRRKPSGSGDMEGQALAGRQRNAQASTDP